jgi:FLVCR family feline leukemia virus subgroup C receptor-related protein
LGSLIAGMGRPFIINIQANVAKEWFKPEDKTTVMIAFSFIITCSSVFGYVILATLVLLFQDKCSKDMNSMKAM